MAGFAGEGYWVFAGTCGALSLLTLVGSLSRLRRDRLIADTPLVRLRSAAQGYVRVEGRAQSPPGEDMRAPLSNRACVWWDFQVSYKDKAEDGTVTVRTLNKGTSVTPFVMQDQDGECLVGPVGAEVTASTTDTWSGYTSNPGGPPPLRPLLGDGGDYVYHERLITPSTRICVLGELRSHTEFGAVDQKARELLARWKHDQAGLLRRFDHNHDGQIDAQEWESARAAARSQAEGTVLHSPIERVGVIGQPIHGGPFLIAPLYGEQVVRRERRRALALLAVSIVLLAAGIWGLGKAHSSTPSFGPAASKEIPT